MKRTSGSSEFEPISGVEWRARRAERRASLKRLGDTGWTCHRCEKVGHSDMWGRQTGPCPLDGPPPTPEELAALRASFGYET